MRSKFYGAALAASLAATPLVAAAQSQPMPDTAEMVERIERADARLFWGFFEGCDPDSVAELIHDDFRMVHDLVGLPAASGAQMVGQAREMCAARGEGGPNEGYRNRRLLVPGSREIRRMGDWGALESGMHTFHEWREDPNSDAAEWVMTGGARYMHVWQWMPEEGRFRLLESLSYDHGAVMPYPPE